MLIFGIGCILIAMGLIMLIYVDDNTGWLIPIGLFLTGVGVGFIVYWSNEMGIEEGAYKMLRNEYEISYVINSDSVVTDTIIHVK